MVNRIKQLMKIISSVIILRLAYIFLSMIIQLLILLSVLWLLEQNFIYFYAICAVGGLTLSLRILNNRSNPAYKMAWVILILFLPVFGIMIYYLFGSGYMKPRVRQGLELSEQKVRAALKTDDSLIQHVKSTNTDIANQMQYLYHTGGFPVYQGTIAEFLTPGEVKFERMKEELRKAESFIFIEYFIIANGVMWQGILDILKEKAAAGVEVRVMYDDFGSLLTLPSHYGQYLNDCGIQHCVFGKMIPVLSALLNHRDHRKILVIDGKVGFTGGINIADEYINQKEKHGYWKDASIMIKGEAVWSLTVFFWQCGVM